MFTWICPQCGKEVPPHETECPHCKEAANAPPAGQQPPASAPPQPSPQGAPPQQYAPPQPAAAPQQPMHPQQPPAAPQYPQYPRQQQPQGYPPPGQPHPQQAQPQQGYVLGGNQRRLPGWLVTLLVAAVLVGIGFVVYKYVLTGNSGAAATSASESPFEEVPGEGEMAATANRLARHIEATGFRITETPDKRLQIQFLVVNHSGADIGDLKGTVHLRTTESDDVLSSFDFNTSRLGPYESVEFKAIMTGGMRAYEAPDWQFLRADVEITSPSGL